MLLSHEVDVNSRDIKEGKTALYDAIIINYLLITKALLLFGADHTIVEINGKRVGELHRKGSDETISDEMRSVLRIVAVPSKKPEIVYGKKTHLLSLDGGGIRGLVLTTEIEREIPKFFDRIELPAGTSTGSILSMALSQGKTSGECRNIYFKFK
ncbi:hypothetical protein PENTCL1PPCAC_21098, partial [Pristionchus entomophagus]